MPLMSRIFYTNIFWLILPDEPRHLHAHLQHPSLLTCAERVFESNPGWGFYNPIEALLVLFPTAKSLREAYVNIT